jgi:hypothetical protein
MGTLLALTLAGCAVGQPLAPPASGGTTFETKLINFDSFASQFAAQTNFLPNYQANSTSQGVQSNTATFGAIAGAVGTGNAADANGTAQALLNNIGQPQTQNNLVL